jgi:hypothetical protein
MAVKIKLTKPTPEPRTERWQVEKDGEHFFASSYMHWNSGTDLLDVLSRQAKLDKASGVRHCVVYKVPAPLSEDYEVEYYRPLVAGTTVVTVIEY